VLNESFEAFLADPEDAGALPSHIGISIIEPIATVARIVTEPTTNKFNFARRCLSNLHAKLTIVPTMVMRETVSNRIARDAPAPGHLRL
jgi:hypothetical protein